MSCALEIMTCQTYCIDFRVGRFRGCNEKCQSAAFECAFQVVIYKDKLKDWQAIKATIKPFPCLSVCGIITICEICQLQIFLHCNTIGRADEVDKAQVISKNQCTTAVTWARGCLQQTLVMIDIFTKTECMEWMDLISSTHVFNGWAKGSNLWRGRNSKMICIQDLVLLL